MVYAKTIRETVFGLRRKGYSYSYISNKIGTPKSTLSGWLSNVPYSPNQETIDRIGKARAASAEWKARRKMESYNKATEAAKNDIGKLTKRDLLMLGLGIYIGEGSKTNDIIRVINAD